ncbi:hypothetical protein SBDP2_480011 [Syntrophobacter sp. SbD2]|nr:hypothetical protein SBDP2_480011 [Syntrophobacter sp. SbD2]
MAQPSKEKGKMSEGFLCGNPAAAPFKDLDDFYNRGQLVHLEEFFVYEPEELITKILVPVKEPDYSRASIEDALNALELTPDPDFVGKLILADHVHPMTPWLQQTQGMVVMGESSEDGVIVLYRPSSSSIRQSIVHEWCNLLRIYHSNISEFFSLTATLEDFIDLETGKVIDDQRIAWNTLGCLLIREQEETVFSLCVRFPLKAAILGRALVKSMLAVSDFRRTARFQFFLDRATFIDFSASKVGFDALKKFPDWTSTTEKLIEFLGEQDLLRSIRGISG